MKEFNNPESEPNRVDEAREALANLSECFGEPDRHLDGYFFTNDIGLAEVAPKVIETFDGSIPEGIGIIIGTGGITSWLPDLAIEVPVIIDTDTALIDMQKITIDSITSSDSPQEAIDKIRAPENVEESPVADIFLRYDDFGVNGVDTGLESEIQQFGEFHWTNPKRFPLAKQALTERPPVFINGDLTNPDLAAAISDISERFDQPVNFANLTNVHAWLERNMDFLYNFSLRPDTPVLFSSNEGLKPPTFPKAILTDLTGYLHFTDPLEENWVGFWDD